MNHRLIFLMMIVVQFAAMEKILAQGPISAEYTSFEPNGSGVNVNLATGDFNYRIPLFELPGPNGGYPILMHYNAGIKMNQEASWVGLGWNINVGSIARHVNGYPDDYKNKVVKLLTNKNSDFSDRYNYNIGSINQPSFNFFKSQQGSGANSLVQQPLSNEQYNSLSATDKSLFNNFLDLCGPLYFKNAENLQNSNTKEQKYNHVMDIYNHALMQYENFPEEKSKNPEPALPNYDDYLVTAQGLVGVMEPAIFENGSLLEQGYETRTPSSDLLMSKFTNKIEGSSFSKSHSDIHFYFKGDPSGFGEMTEVNIDNSASSSSPTITGGVFNSTNSKNESFYNPVTKHLGQAKYVRWYTNAEISASEAFVSTNGIITGTLAEEGVMGYQPLNAARNDIKMFDPDGIGGFSITSENGTTYHYALPVYQFQKVDIIQNKANTSEDFIESSDLNMHAVNWLLTGITGPDFQDIGVNKGFIDDGDLGYWVKFNYGKWSDGFLWRTPHGNMEFEEYRDLGVVQYSFGLKQLYYLNSAETKSHVAYFVKELRNDNIGRSLISESRKVSDAMVKIDINGDQWNYGGNHTVNYSLNYPIEHRQLKLSRILLFKKNSSPNINTAYGSTSQSHFDSYLYFNRNTNLTGGGNQNESVELRKAGCHYYNNVLIEKDIRHLNSKIRESILKEIVFNSDYSLASNFSGSTLLSGSTHLGKLTLNSVKIRGEYQSEIMPSYKFYYENPNYPYNNIFKDDWGSVVGLSINYIKQLANKDINFSFIDKSLASTWSLNRIIEPSGVEYEVQLESDAYEREAAFKYSEYAIEYFRIISSTQIEVKFVGNPSIEAFQENFNSNAPFTFYINLNEIKLGGTLKLDFPEKLFTCKLISKTNGIFLFEELSGTKINEMQSSFGPFQILNGGSNTDPIYPSSECSAFALGNAFGPMIGGGIRVKKIKTTDTKTNESSTIEYDYTKNGKTTGMTTYAPREIKRVIPFVNDIPGPQVYYAQVTSLYKGSDKNGPGGLLKKLIHNFEVPKLYTQSNGFGKYELKPCLKIERIKSITSNIWEGKFYPNTNPPVQILNSYNHVAYLISSFPATLGRPTSIFEYNYRGELVSQSIYSYSDIYSSGNYQEGFRFLKNTGKIQETFNQSKFYVIHHDFYSQSNYQEFTNKSFVTKAIGASVLTEVASSHFGDFNYSKLNDYDLFNGQPRKVESHGSQDEPIIRVSHFAHEIKHGSNDLNPLLQSKLYETNSNKKYNMLNAPGKEEVYLGNSLLGASAIKYSSNLNVRQFNSSSGKFETASSIGSPMTVKSTHYFEGVLSQNNNGSINTTVPPSAGKGYFYDINWNNPGASSWKTPLENTLYDSQWRVLESKDISGVYSCSKRGYNDEHVVVSCVGSRFTECTYSGAEDYIGGSSYDFLSELKLGNATVIHKDNFHGKETHTGENVFKISAGSNGLVYNYQTGSDLEVDKKYIVVLWQHVPSTGYSGGVPELIIEDVQTSLNSSIDFISNETAFGNWKRLECEFTTSSSASVLKKVYISCANCSEDFYFDDFRLQPVGSVMEAFVYDKKTDRVTAELDVDNIASKYYYDDFGRLIKTEREVPRPVGVDGFVQSSEIIYNVPK